MQKRLLLHMNSLTRGFLILPHCIRNRFSDTMYWKDPISILGTSGYEIDIFLEKIAKLFANSGDPGFALIANYPIGFPDYNGLNNNLIQFLGPRFPLLSYKLMKWGIHLNSEYHFYPKYWDTLLTYHTCPKICNNPFYYLLMCLKYCCMHGKHCWPGLNAASCGVWSGSTLFVMTYLSKYLGLLR